MEIIQCTKEGVQGWKYGENGECHIGLEGKQRAFQDRAEAKAEEFMENPAPLPVNEEPEEVQEEQVEEQNNEQAPEEQNQNSDENSENQQP